MRCTYRASTSKASATANSRGCTVPLERTSMQTTLIWFKAYGNSGSVAYGNE